MDLKQLAEKWLEEAETLRRYGDERGARILELHAAEVREAEVHAGNEELTLAAAVLESGYSERALRQMIADQVIPNAGKKGAPRIRRADLPHKPRKQDAAQLTADFKARARIG